MAVLGCTMYQDVVKCIPTATFTLMVGRSAKWEGVEKQMHRLLLAARSRLTVLLAGHEHKYTHIKLTSSSLSVGISISSQ